MKSDELLESTVKVLQVKLTEDKIIDFNKEKQKLKHSYLQNLDPNSKVEPLSIIQVLDSLIFIINEYKDSISEDNVYNRKQMQDLISLKDNLSKKLNKCLKIKR